MVLNGRTCYKIVHEEYLSSELPEDGKINIDGLDYKFKKGDILLQNKQTGKKEIHSREYYKKWFIEPIIIYSGSAIVKTDI